jgi:hypothetical protein
VGVEVGAGWAKSNALSKLLALASASVSAGRFQRHSMNFKIDVVSYTV